MVQVLVCNMTASGNKQLLLDLGSNNITAVAVGELPHTRATRAMDVQSALSSLDGHQAVIEGIHALGALTGTSSFNSPKVLVIGSDVAARQAIATAKHVLGSCVFATDTDTRGDARARLESRGVRYIDPWHAATSTSGDGSDFDAQRAMLMKVLPSMDLVICSAANRDNTAPQTLDGELVRVMGRGKCIVDLTSSNTRPGEVVVDGVSGVKIVGMHKAADCIPAAASIRYSSCIVNILKSSGGAAAFSVTANPDINAMVMTRHGSVTRAALRIFTQQERPDLVSLLDRWVAEQQSAANNTSTSN